MSNVKHPASGMPWKNRKWIDSGSILHRWMNDSQPVGVLDGEGEAGTIYPLRINLIKEEEREAYLDKRFGLLISTEILKK